MNDNNITMDTIEIKKSNLEAAYKQADDNTKELLATLFADAVKLLATLFGDAIKDKDDRDDRPVTERIKTFEDAMDELGYKHPLVVQYREIYDNFLDVAGVSDISDIVAYLKLRVICAALNEGWEPKFIGDERRYYPIFRLYSKVELNCMGDKEKQERCIIDTTDYVTGYGCMGFGFMCSTNAFTYNTEGFCSRLCLRNNDLAIYCGEQFTELWADLNLIKH